MSKDLRRYPRRSLLGQLLISWQFPRGTDKFSTGRLLEVSEWGIRLEVPEQIRPNTNVYIRCEKLDFSGSGQVRHCARSGSKYVVGVALSAELRMKLQSPGGVNPPPSQTPS